MMVQWYESKPNLNNGANKIIQSFVVGLFLKKNGRFVIDKVSENKLLITIALAGYLKCVKD
jgi:cephalosporin hydroxylase